MKNLFSILFISLFIFSCLNDNKVLNGTVTSYYENNSVKEIRIYTDGEVESYKTFDESGNLHMESISIDSLKSKTVNYYKNGNIQLVTYNERPNIKTPRMKSKMSKYTLYYKNGNIYLEGYQDSDGLNQINSWNKDGKQTLINGNGFYSTSYKESGTLKSKGSVKNGKLDKLWIYYNEDGSIQKDETYKDGELIETQEY